MAFMDYVKLYRDKGKETWVKLNPRQRWIFSGIGAAILLGFILLVASFGGSTGGMVELKSIVRDPQKAIQRLATFGINAKFDDKKKNVTVPAEYEERAALILNAANMLPHASQYYGFLMEGDFKTTDKQRLEATRVSLQSLLSDTIRSMDFVADASVDISAPATPWNFDLPSAKRASKASVILELRGQNSLTDDQVAAIAHLVANSYPLLEPQAVSIVDKTTGRPYYYEPISAVISTAWKLKSELERTATQKITDLLAAYNPRVSVQIPVATREETGSSHSFGSEESRIDYTESRGFKSKGERKEGAAGARGGIGPDPSESTSDMTRFETSRDEEEGLTRFVHPGTDIKWNEKSPHPLYDKGTVAIMLAEDHKSQFTSGLDSIKNLAAKAANVPIANVEILFSPMPQIGTGESSGLTGWAAMLLKPENLVKIVLLVLAIGAFIALMIMLKKSAPKPLATLDDEMVDEEPEALPDVPALPPASQLEGNVVREKVVELVKKNPKAAANLIKRWMILGK